MPVPEQLAETFEREIRELAKGPRYDGEIGEADILSLKRLFAEVIAAEESPIDGEMLYQDISRFER